MRTNFYVDGFNLYYGCLKGGDRKWLNLSEFCRLSFPPPDYNLHHVHYFTARVKDYPSNPDQSARQQVYLRALRTRPEITPHFGKFRQSKTFMRLVDAPPEVPCAAEVWKSEEKGSDVNLATRLLVDAFRGECEAAVVVSNDSDLVEPIRVARDVLGVRVIVLFPVRPGMHGGNALKKVASYHRTIDPEHLAAAQFPARMTDAKGDFHKPCNW